MRTARASVPATYDDLLRVPDELIAEILAGELHTSPRPTARHSLVSSVLGGELGARFQWGKQGPGGWWILDEPEIHLGRDVLVPDLAGWRRTRLPAIPEAAYLELAPDWLCEVLSPGTEQTDRTKKLPIYAREGVQHVWLVNPGARTVEVHRLESGHWLLLATHAGDEQMRAQPFEDPELDLLHLWAESRSES